MPLHMNSAFVQWRAGVLAVGSLSEVAREITACGFSFSSTTIKTELLQANTQAASQSNPELPKPNTFDFEEIDHEQSGGGPGTQSLSKVTAIPRCIIEKCKFFTELHLLVFLCIAIV
ncbi:hypothetical protein BBJ28_00024371 [Nothophytophthora sp. Chile5]|nr:hypothetical protein BBJ28_00024371 [Nothophytophthora sp. Chile5]